MRVHCQGCGKSKDIVLDPDVFRLLEKLIYEYDIQDIGSYWTCTSCLIEAQE